MATLRVAVNGAKGRMGQAVIAAVTGASDMDLVAQTDLGDDLARVLVASNAEVCVDFTLPSVAYPNAAAILEAGVRPVIGTTGFTSDDLARLGELARTKDLGAVIAPNFAIGAVLMMRFAREAAPFFAAGEIVELHHERKADAPSGTALATARAMREARTEPFLAQQGAHEMLPGCRGGIADDIRIHSVRMPGLLAHQEVLLGDPGQTLTIRHDSMDRACFMPGVLRAVRAVPGLSGLVVGLEAILFPEA